MLNKQNVVNGERSLLDEIEELDVLEAEELQEGVAFHAFRFSSAGPLEALNSVILVVKDGQSWGDKLTLPHGATLTEAHEDKLVVLFDAKQVQIETVQKYAKKQLGESLTNIEYDPAVTFNITKIGK